MSEKQPYVIDTTWQIRYDRVPSNETLCMPNKPRTIDRFYDDVVWRLGLVVSHPMTGSEATPEGIKKRVASLLGAMHEWAPYINTRSYCVFARRLDQEWFVWIVAPGYWLLGQMPFFEPWVKAAETTGFTPEPDFAFFNPEANELKPVGLYRKEPSRLLHALVPPLDIAIPLKPVTPADGNSALLSRWKRVYVNPSLVAAAVTRYALSGLPDSHKNWRCVRSQRGWPHGLYNETLRYDATSNCMTVMGGSRTMGVFDLSQHASFAGTTSLDEFRQWHPQWRFILSRTLDEPWTQETWMELYLKKASFPATR